MRELPEKNSIKCSECSTIILNSGELKGVCQKHNLSVNGVFKCRFCCSMATFHCGSNKKGCYFCNKCHNKAGQYVDFLTWNTKVSLDSLKQCSGKDSCPLKVDHPLNGIEFAVGCNACL